MAGPKQNIVLITGTKAGIGKEFLQRYAARDNTVAIAAIRDGPDSPVARSLQSLPTGTNSSIIVVKYDAASEASVKQMASDLQSTHGITYLDTVIANAGVLNSVSPVRSISSTDILDTFTVNTLGVIRLYQATIPLLDQSEKPKFFIISSALGSFGMLRYERYTRMPMLAYNMSKTAVNFAAGKIDVEEKRLVVVPVHPGWIATEMGSKAAVMNGMDASAPPVNLQESVAGMMNLFDKATKEQHSGKFLDFTGQPVPW